jgi:ATPase subunit of ABC transporter with duplicated ATPase domains
MISVSNLAKEFGDRTLFQSASFQLNPGERYGLVGANGSGKTTLLGILTGDEPASAGHISIPSRIDMGVLRQDQFLYEDEEILGVAMRGNPELWEAMVEKERILANAAEHFDTRRYGIVEETIERHDGYAAEARAAEILEGLGIPTEVHRRPLSTLSGGFKLRVLLAQALAGSPDILLLDEPTNHLDILSIRWLEKFLRGFGGPVVVISHDHRFLDNVSTHILDVDYQTVTLYHGNYTAFVEQKREERERREKEIGAREKEIAHHREFVDRFRAKASKARQAQSKLRMIEKKAEQLEPLAPSSRRYPAFRFDPYRPSGRDVLELDGIRKAYAENEVLHGVDLEVRRGDRLAIMGPNGIGKSTLLKIAVGELAADNGEVEWGHAVRVGYFAQDHHEQLDDPGVSAEQWIAHHHPALSTTYLRGAMGAVLFSGDEAEKRLSALSGGEAARLVFCKLALEKPNVLVLDEPTNHLDLESIEALVEGLREYEGTLVFVSHDRWFVSQLANRVVEITATGIRDYRGTYEEYVHWCGDDHLDVDTVVEKERSRRSDADGPTSLPANRAAANGDTNGRSGGASTSAPTSRSDSHPVRNDSESIGAGSEGGRRRDPYKLRKLEERRDELTSRIDRAESRLGEIERAFADPGLYAAERQEEVRSLEEERTRLQGSIEKWMAEWESAERELAR